MVVLTTEEFGKMMDALELLLQAVELIPDAEKHVKPYVTHAQLHELQENLKGRL